MSQIVPAAIVLLLLCAGAGLGFFLQSRLPEAHRSKESIDLLTLATGLLVTFSALMLGLILNSAKNTFEAAGHDRSHYAAQLTQLDLTLSNYGAGTEAARRELHGYTAAVIASTWPDEPRPTGLDYPDPTTMARTGSNPVLADLLNDVGLEIAGLAPTDRLHEKLAAECTAQFSRVLQARWPVVEDAKAFVSPPFYQVLVVWLSLTFGCLCLRAPPNVTVVIVVMLVAVAASSAMFVIADLATPYGGVFTITSTSMRDALADMMRVPIAGANTGR